MNDAESITLEELIAAHLEGRTLHVPDAMRSEFATALAAHQALAGLIDETKPCAPREPETRRLPELPDEYEIEREIGRGGMGVVYLVRQRSLHREVALKVLRPGEQMFGALVQRFLGEARHLARLRHPNIVSIHEVGHAGGEPYFTMDYIDGEPLSAVLARGPLPPTQTLALFKQIAAAVQHAHANGIIHRDLKPSNVLVDHSGNVFVTDFGLARDISRDSNLTQSGELLGTPQYMSPEQARGQTALIGEATDIHALGLLLFEMLSGRAAFTSSSPADVLVRLLNEEPPLLRSLDRRIPRDLETICQKTLQKAPSARYTTVSALLEDIRRFESGEPLVARRTSAVTRVLRWSQRHWKLVAAMAGTALLMLVILAGVGPQLFDKTDEELIAWAEELHSEGSHEEAIQVYRRLLEKSAGEERRAVLNSMIRCCGEIGDAKGVLAAALPILDEAPRASFGKHDYLVAQAVYADMIEQRPNLTASVASRSEEDDAQLQFAAQRYQLFLDGPHGSREQRELAARKLREIHEFLDASREPHEVVASPPAESRLPEGTIEELQQLAADATVTNWERGKALYAAGLQLEQAGHREQAGQAFREAFHLLRAVFPTYSGISTAMRHSKARGLELIERDECGLLQEVFAAAQRLDPELADMLQGGLRFRIQGVELPADLVPKLNVELVDLSLEASAGHDRSLPRSVAFHGQSAEVGVADGRYRMKVRDGGSNSFGDSASRIGGLLELDLSELTREVEIAGNTLEFLIPARLAAEITLLEPAVGATADLRTDFFRWSEIEDAEYYYLTLARKDSYVGVGDFYQGGATLRVTSNTVCLSTLPESERHKTDWLAAGMTVQWSVHAFDNQDRRIGTSVQSDRIILVGQGLREDAAGETSP